MLAKRANNCLVITVTAVVALRQLGFKVAVLLGAASVVAVALGFASISAERSFVIGDVIQVGSTAGEVVAVDRLPVKLRISTTSSYDCRMNS